MDFKLWVSVAHQKLDALRGYLLPYEEHLVDVVTCDGHMVTTQSLADLRQALDAVALRQTELPLYDETGIRLACKQELIAVFGLITNAKRAVS